MIHAWKRRLSRRPPCASWRYLPTGQRRSAGSTSAKALPARNARRTTKTRTRPCSSPVHSHQPAPPPSPNTHSQVPIQGLPALLPPSPRPPSGFCSPRRINLPAGACAPLQRMGALSSACYNLPAARRDLSLFPFESGTRHRARLPYRSLQPASSAVLTTHPLRRLADDLRTSRPAD